MLYLLSIFEKFTLCFQTATLSRSFERMFAIRRNAIIDGNITYETPLDVLNAVSNGTVEIALLDALTTTKYVDTLKELNLRVDQILDIDMGYGLALSGGLEILESDVRSLILSNQAYINHFVKTNVDQLFVSPV